MLRRSFAFAGIITGVFLMLALVLSPSTVDAQATFGTNWGATFFTETNFTGTSVATTYPNGLNFNWPGVPTQADNVTPVPGFTEADNFSVRFTSTQTFAAVGTYTFFGFVDDQMTVFIGGQQAFQQTVPGNFSFDFVINTTTATIQIDYVELTVTSAIQFQWQPSTGQPPVDPGTGATAIPPNFTPAPTVFTGPTGTVVQVSGLSLRTGPYLGASFIGVLRPGNSYPVLAKNNDEGGGFTWYKVVDGDRTGWASGRYLVVNGDVPEEGTVFQTLDNPASTGVLAAPRAFMNFRFRPSVRSDRFDQIPWGETVEVLGRTIRNGTSFWLLVRYNGRVGWAFAPYFTFTFGGPNQLPTY